MTEHSVSTADQSGAGEMRAIRIHEHGGSDVLRAETVPRPEPSDDELLVRVRAAGVNPIDWMIREGYTDEALSPSLPSILGWDLSGIVETVGPDVSEFGPGDEVYGLVGMPDPGEAYAEYAAVSADEVVTKPAPLSHTEAAGLPMVGLTAWRALFDAGALRDGQRVLVHAAAGGVGHGPSSLRPTPGHTSSALHPARTRHTSGNSASTNS